MTRPLIIEFFEQMEKAQASDLYLTVGYPPAMRLNDRMEKLSDELIDDDMINDILSTILTVRQRREFDTHMELNTSLNAGEYGRYRVNVLRQRQHPAIVLRRIISKIPTFEQLRLPPFLGEIAMEKRGLVLLTGMTGSGKSTSLAAMVDYRNKNAQGHIVTIEDPIEYFHDHGQSVVTQREVGVDTESYATALKNVLRQRPDVILVGEVRDREVMEQTLMAAETGHLCFATLHTSNAYQSIDRIINMFPEEYQQQVRLNLSLNLKAIVSQRLLPSLKGGVVLATEVLLNQGLVRELIQEGKIGKIKDVMEQNAPSGMCSFDQSLLGLYREGMISEDTALSHADKPADLKVKIQKVTPEMKNAGAGLNDMDLEDLSFSD